MVCISSTSRRLEYGEATDVVTVWRRYGLASLRHGQDPMWWLCVVGLASLNINRDNPRPIGTNLHAVANAFTEQRLSQWRNVGQRSS